VALRDPVVPLVCRNIRRTCGCWMIRAAHWIEPIRFNGRFWSKDLLTHTSGLGYGFSVGGRISRAIHPAAVRAGSPTRGWPRSPSYRWCINRVND